MVIYVRHTHGSIPKLYVVRLSTYVIRRTVIYVRHTYGCLRKSCVAWYRGFTFSNPFTSQNKLFFAISQLINWANIEIDWTSNITIFSWRTVLYNKVYNKNQKGLSYASFLVMTLKILRFRYIYTGSCWTSLIASSSQCVWTTTPRVTVDQELKL